MLELLEDLFSKQNLPLYFIHGPSGTGKTFSVNAALQSQCHFTINCQFYDSLQPIIRQIGVALGINKRVGNVRELIEELVPLRLARPVFIVLDHADALLEIDPRGLGLLCRLRQLSRCQASISIVLISRKSWSEFGPLTSACFPYVLTSSFQFPSTGSIFGDELAKDNQEFVKLISSTTMKQHRDMPFLINLMKQYKPHYPEPRGLKILSELMNGKKLASFINEDLIQSLSLVEKYLIFAVYLASKISPRNDCKVFHHQATGKRRMTRKGGPTKKVSTEFVKEKKKSTVPLERILAIFYHIYQHDRRAPPRSLVLPALQNLVQHKFVLRMTPCQKIDSCKFKSNVSQAIIQALSKSTGFQYGMYLHFDA